MLSPFVSHAKVLGTPNEERWPTVTQLPEYKARQQHPQSTLCRELSPLPP